MTIKANNLVPNNFLTPDGLHWSENTQVIPINGQTTGQISAENFGKKTDQAHLRPLIL